MDYFVDVILLVDEMNWMDWHFFVFVWIHFMVDLGWLNELNELVGWFPWNPIWPIESNSVVDWVVEINQMHLVVEYYFVVETVVDLVGWTIWMDWYCFADFEKIVEFVVQIHQMVVHFEASKDLVIE